LARTNRCDWTAAALSLSVTKRLGSLTLRLLRFARTGRGQPALAGALPPGPRHLSLWANSMADRSTLTPDKPDFSFARVRSHKGLTAWPGQVSHRCVRSLRQEGPAIEPGAVLTLFWSRRVGMGPGPAVACRRDRGLDPDG
jgi:hypothetical protein